MGLGRLESAAILDPYRLGREGTFPALGLLRGEVFRLEDLLALKQAEPREAYVVFPVKEAAEVANLEKLLAILEPLAPAFIQGGWLAFGGDEPGDLPQLTQTYPWLRFFPARRFPPPDQAGRAWGKGAVMRALLYHLMQSGAVTDPRAIIQFIDADIVPAYFNVNWCLGAVGSIIWFKAVEAAKLVYFRPLGGRLNAFLRSLLAAIPHAGVQRLQQLIYLLSGEMAATLKFWSAVPFKTGYGVEVLILLSLALEQVRLRPGQGDLEQVAQIFVGEMDHRHAPLQSTRQLRGLDQMAGNVCRTVLETLEQAGILSWPQGGSPPERVCLPVPGTGPHRQPHWLQVAVGEETLAPLQSLPEVAAALTSAD